MMEHSILLVVFTAFLFHVDGILGSSCPSTAATVRIVDKCPKTEQAWKEAAARKRCPMLGQTQYCSNFQYHCLVNQWQNATLEVCAPTWYISGFCTMFNTDENRVIDNFRLDCTNFTEPCPTRYISTDAYKYQQCYMYQLVNKTVNDRPQRFKEKEHVTPTLHSSDTPWKIVAVVFISLFTILLFVGTLLLVKYARKYCLEANGVEEETGVGDPNTSANIESSIETSPLIDQEGGDIGVDGNRPLVNSCTEVKRTQKSGGIGVGVNRPRGNNNEIKIGGNSTALLKNDIEALKIAETEALKNRKHVTSFSSPTSTTDPKRDGVGERKPKTTKEDLKNNKEENEVGGENCVKSGEENAKTFKTFVDQDILASDKENPDKKLTTDHHSEGESGINNDPPTDIAENTEGNKESDEDKQDSKGEEESSEIIPEDDSPSAPGENSGEKVTKEHDFSTKAEVKNGRNTDDKDTLMTDKGNTGQDDPCRQEHTKKDEFESRKGKVIAMKEQFENEANKPP